MKPGKISQSVLKRSVLKYCNETSENVIKGVGEDCALFSVFENENHPGKKTCMAASVCTMSLPISAPLLMEHAIYGAVNNLAAKNVKASYILLAITMAERIREEKLKLMMQKASQICESLKLDIIGGHTEVSPCVSHIVVSVTAFGSEELAEKEYASKAEGKINAADSINQIKKMDKKKDKTPSYAGYDLIITKYPGMEAASLLAYAKEEELKERFPGELIEQAKGFSKYMAILPEAATAIKSGGCVMHDVREGGLFGALWELAENTGTGLSINLKAIPMKQSIIEICNYFDINPYESLSAGCLLIAAPNGEKVVEELAKKDIKAQIIGKLTEGNDRIIENGEEARYLDLPKPDEIRKILK